MYSSQISVRVINMITQESPEKAAPRDPNEIKDVTVHLFKEYLHTIEQQYGEMICPTCKGSLWNIPISPNDSEHPNVVTMPMPLNAGFGVWAFHIICDQCGNMRFFEAATTIDSLRHQMKL